MPHRAGMSNLEIARPHAPSAGEVEEWPIAAACWLDRLILARKPATWADLLPDSWRLAPRRLERQVKADLDRAVDLDKVAVLDRAVVLDKAAASDKVRD